MSNFITSLQYGIENPGQSNQMRKRKDIQRYPKWKKNERKLSLFIDYMILYMENSKDYRKAITTIK